jgi:hypothetical protein
MASGGYVHVQLNPSGAPNVGYGRNTACVRDPYYHLAKDKSYVTYPDAQDTADRLRAIRWPRMSSEQPRSRGHFTQRQPPRRPRRSTSLLWEERMPARLQDW